ncbi:MAG: flagellar FliJ family protein [Planctomycetota bacterium]|nr:flagellar FliJ family protein [Planctomycetota bacterium]
MKAFTFRLQRVLDLRLSREREAQRVLASVNRARGRLEDCLRESERCRQQSSKQLRAGMVGVLSIEELRLQASIGQQHARRARQLVFELAAIHPQIEAAQTSLAKATAERRGLEYLRDRARKEWMQDCQRIERREEAEAALVGGMAI